MSVFRVQKVRSCVQCGDVLALKCGACAKHPERRPRVLEVYDWPEVLKTAECGCCIKIRCQLEGCTQTMWRNIKHNRAGKAASRGSFCSIRCSARSMAAARVTRETVPCDWCARPVVKKSYALKTWKKSYCNRTCYFLRRAKDQHGAAEAKRLAAKEDSKLAMLECRGRCRTVTEHTTTGASSAMCRACGTARTTRTSSMDCSETMSVARATKTVKEMAR